MHRTGTKRKQRIRTWIDAGMFRENNDSWQEQEARMVGTYNNLGPIDVKAYQEAKGLKIMSKKQGEDMPVGKEENAANPNNCRVETYIQYQVPEHMALLSFDSDSSADNFFRWWFEIGKELFANADLS
jgi:hypothetical protein